MKEKRLCIITSEWENGAGKKGTSHGPNYILESLEKSPISGLQTANISSVKFSPQNNHLNTAEHPSNPWMPFLKNGRDLLHHQTTFANKVEHQLNSGHFCLLLTADHSNGIGGVSGLCKTTTAETVGIIWIDAHYDLHSPYTTPSGNSHGMAVNGLIDDNNTECAEQGIAATEAHLWESIKNIKGIGNAVPPQNVVFIGVRDFETAEATLVEKHNICSIQPAEISEIGIAQTIEKTLSHLKHCENLYVSFDVDSLDPSISRATGTPVEGGLTINEAKQLLRAFCSDPRTRCLEITEFNPTLPQPEEMLKAIREVLPEI